MARRGHTARPAAGGAGLAEADADVPVPLAMARHSANPDFADDIWAAVDAGKTCHALSHVEPPRPSVAQ
jgi:hypothetical protein